MMGVIVFFLFTPFSTLNTLDVCSYPLTILVHFPYLSHSCQYEAKKRIHWDPHLYEMTATDNYQFLWRPWDSELPILDEVMTIFCLTTPQFLSLHPPFIYGRNLMIQLSTTETIQHLLKLLKWNLKINRKWMSRISAFDGNQDLDQRQHGLWRRCHGEIGLLPQSVCRSCIPIAGHPIMRPSCSLAGMRWSYYEGDSQLQINAVRADHSKPREMSR